jgi:hypothetical protein
MHSVNAGPWLPRQAPVRWPVAALIGTDGVPLALIDTAHNWLADLLNSLFDALATALVDVSLEDNKESRAQITIWALLSGRVSKSRI